MPTVNQQILDRTVRHQIGLHRLSTQVSIDAGALLSQGNTSIVQLLETINQDTTPRKIEGILRAIKRLNEQAYTIVLAGLISSMVELAKYEIEFQNRMFSEVLGQLVTQQLRFSLPSNNLLKSTVESQPFDGALLSEYIAGAEVGRYNRIRDAVRREYQKGDASVSGAILASVLGTSIAGFADGVFGTGLRSLEQITRTVQNGVVSAVRDLIYNNNAHMFFGVQWVSTLDTSTGSICQQLDGKMFLLGSGSRPPAHRNCRSTIIPLVRSWQDLKLRDLSVAAKAELDGQVPERITYAQWLSRQPAAIQDEVLGPTRGRMYRKGEVTLDRFVDKKGRRYTLEQLARREGLSL